MQGLEVHLECLSQNPRGCGVEWRILLQVWRWWECESKCKGKGEVHPRTGNEGPERE